MPDPRCATNRVFLVAETLVDFYGVSKRGVRRQFAAAAESVLAPRRNELRSDPIYRNTCQQLGPVGRWLDKV
jgi:hypothetical protein